MSVVSRTQSTTRFVTSLNRSVTVRLFFVVSDICFVMAVSPIHFEELIGLMNNNEALFDFLRKNNALFHFCVFIVCVILCYFHWLFLMFMIPGLITI